MVMNPGHWTVTITIEKSLFLDYFVLLPAEYYEASILTQEVSTPCQIGYKGLCRHYAYPSISKFNSVLGTGGYIGDNNARNPLTEYLTDQDTLEELGESKIPLINDVQKKVHFELTITKPGHHVLIITYVTPPKTQTRTATVFIEANTMDRGKVTLLLMHNILYSVQLYQLLTKKNIFYPRQLCIRAHSQAYVGKLLPIPQVESPI